MKKTGLRFAVLAAVLILLLSACGSMADIPFSGAKWFWSGENVLAYEGDAVDTYRSVYGGNTYVFEKEFMNRSGTVKYMFDADGNLASVAWAYSSGDSEDVTELFRQICAKETREHGKSEFSNTNDTAYGNVWYLEDCDIIVTTLTTDAGSALQYAYINKDFSKG